MIIGITGQPPAGSGKDVVADYLVKEYGFVKVAMADPMKRICMDVFGWTEEDLWGPSANRNVPDKRYLQCTIPPNHVLTEEELKKNPGGRIPIYLTSRYALQQLGHEWGRRCYGGVWVDYCMRAAKKILTPYDPHHEVTEVGWRTYTQSAGFNGTFGLNKPGGVVVPDVRYDNEAVAIRKAGGKIWLVQRPGAGLEGDAAKHTSEHSLDPKNVDFCIKNNKGFGWLHQQIRTLMNGKEVTT